MSEPTTLYLYLHTHWDREWYWSFSGYRTQLVSVVKNILDLLESGALNNFVLDGQTALLEDVLEVSPALAPRLKKLIEGGKLFVGPWYVLADQMLVGGESLVRNLRYGLQLCRSFGGASKVGYCPDTFGHSADLPRILRGFEIGYAVVWRGVPKLAGSPLFDWKSPDGSEVVTLDLTQGYYQSSFAEGLTSEALAKVLLNYLDMEQSTTGSVSVNQNSTAAPTVVPEMNGALLPVGADHVGPQADFKLQLKNALGIINKEELYVRPQTVSLDQFFQELNTATKAKFGEARRLIESELRDNAAAFGCARAYMLDGVLSSRLYLKRDNRLSEYKILRQAEPFRALLGVHNILPYSVDELDYNWKLLLKNHPHDSICGCSIDAVHREMLTRTAALDDGLDMLVTQGKEALLLSGQEGAAAKREVRFGARHLDVIDPALALDQLLVFNPGAAVFSGPVRVRLAFEKETAEAANQAVRKVPAGLQQIQSYQATETFLGLSQVPTFKDITVIEGYLEAAAVAPLSLSTIALGETAAAPSKAAVQILEDQSKAFSQIGLSNEYFSLSFDQAGDLQVGTAGGAVSKIGHRLLDVGDAGDTYNFDPIDGDRPLAARLVSVRAGQTGPLVASLIAHYQIDLPEGLQHRGYLAKAGESAQAPRLETFERTKIRIPHKIETEIILKKGVPIVFFETSLQHSAKDHRLEVVFDAPTPVDHTLSENHYSLIKRYHDKKAELHPQIAAEQIVPLGHEEPLSRYPCQRFFVAGEQIFFNQGLPEYGVGDSAVSITLLRAVSYLSRTRLRSRGGGAGPIMPTPEANCPGLVKASYGWSRLDLAAPPEAEPSAEANSETNSETNAYILAELFEADPIAMVAPQGVLGGKNLSLFGLDNPAIRVCATYMDAEVGDEEAAIILGAPADRLVIRLLNVTSKPAEANLTLGFNAKAVHSGQFDGGELKPLKAAGAGGKFSLVFDHCQSMTIFCRI